MGLLFFPLFILFLTTGKLGFLYAALVMLIPAVIGPFFSLVFDGVVSVAETDTAHSVGTWILYGIGALIIYAMLH